MRSLFVCVLAVGLTSACSGDPQQTPERAQAPARTSAIPTVHAWDREAFLAQIETIPEAHRLRALDYAWSLYDARDVRHTFTGASGETIDCVLTTHQPSLRQPDGSFAAIELPPGVTLGATANGPCPTDSVPRTRPDASTFATYMGQTDPNVVFDWYGTPPYKWSTGGYEHSRAVQSVSNQGVMSTLAVYRPSVQTGEHSISQVWVMGQNGTDCANADSSGVCQSVEVGWNVDPSYGDTKPHFFVYSTSDNYRTSSGGCWAMQCPNFVLLNQGGSPLIPGQAIGYTNVGDDPVPHELAISVSRQASNSGWYVWVNADLVGYFQPDYFKHFTFNGIPMTLKVKWFTDPGLRSASNLIRYGGEIINLNVNGKHTTTQMGTGNPASGANGATPAAYQRYLYYFDANGTQHAPSLSLASGTNDYTHPGCYSMSQSGAHPAWWSGSQYLYFGGKGFDASTCK